MPIPNFHADVAAAFPAGGIDGCKNVIDDATIVVALSGEAASYAEATTNLGTGSGKRMASATVAAGDFGLSGAGFTRAVTFGGKAGGTAHAAGNPTVIAFLDGTRILAQVAETGVAVISLTETVTFPSFTVLGASTPA